MGLLCGNPFDEWPHKPEEARCILHGTKLIPRCRSQPWKFQGQKWAGMSQRCPEVSQPVPPWFSAGYQLSRPPQRRHLYGETHQPICTANGLWSKGVKNGAKALSPCAGVSLWIHSRRTFSQTFSQAPLWGSGLNGNRTADGLELPQVPSYPLASVSCFSPPREVPEVGQLFLARLCPNQWGCLCCSSFLHMMDHDGPCGTRG